MLYFIKKYRALLFATALLFSGLVILTGTHENRRDLGVLDKIALDVTGFFVGLLSTVGDGVAHLWFDYVYLVGVREENAALRAEVDRLTLERAALEEGVREADRLRDSLGFRERTGFTAVPAGIIGADVSGWFRTVTIDRGSNDGVERGLAVVSPDGIVGRTHEVASRTTKVLLVTDSNSAVDAMLQRTRGRGVVYGRVTSVLEMRYVHRTEDVVVGDVVLTSGIGGIFPKGLPIGVVSRVDDSATGLFKTVEVTPAADLARLEEILVVTAHAARDFEALTSPRPDPVAAAAQMGDGARPAAVWALPEAAASPEQPAAASPAPARAQTGRPTASAPARAHAGASPSSAHARQPARAAPSPSPAASPVARAAASPRPTATPAAAARPAPPAAAATPGLPALPAAASSLPARAEPGAPPSSLPARAEPGAPPSSSPARAEPGAPPSSSPAGAEAAARPSPVGTPSP